MSVPQHVAEHFSSSTGCDHPVLLRENVNAVYDCGEVILRIALDTERARSVLSWTQDLTRNGAPVVPMLCTPEEHLGYVCAFFPRAQEITQKDHGQIPDLLRQFHSIVPLPGLRSQSLSERLTADLSEIPTRIDRDFHEELRRRTWISQQMLARHGEVTPTVVHGDCYVGNILSYQGKLVFIDLDDLHLGDPCEDLGWMMCSARRIQRDRELECAITTMGADTGVMDRLADHIYVRETLTMLWMARSLHRHPHYEQEFHHRMTTLDDPRAPWGHL